MVKSRYGMRVNEMRKAKSGGERPKYNSEFIKQEKGGSYCSSDLIKAPNMREI